MFQNLVMEDGIVEVTDISEKQESKSRPSGLNTVNLLKVRTQPASIPFFSQFAQNLSLSPQLIALSITWFHEWLYLHVSCPNALCAGFSSENRLISVKIGGL